MSEQRLTPHDYIDDLREQCERIQAFTSGASQQDFAEDVMMQYAVIRAFEILGEASRQLHDVMPDPSTRFPAIPFQQMYALRNRYAHGYATIEPDRVWGILHTQIPAVLAAVKDVLAHWPADLA